MKFGVCYYPEHWDRKEWRDHARLMREAGFNTARLADFAWGVLEPEEGRYDFSLLDEAVAVLGEEGLDVILCTPTAGPPKWLADRYDILQNDRYGRPAGWGSRREGCANKADFCRFSALITDEMARHYGDHPKVAAWQIDNEFGCHASARCYCEQCRRAFSRWLAEKYGEIENLNRAWGTVFWSHQYASFEDVILPAYNACEPENAQSWSHNPSLDMEYRRFASDSWVNYQKMQTDIIRKYTDQPVTHNMMGHFSDIDYYDLARGLDFVAWDNYPDNQWGESEYAYVSMAHEIMYGVKRKNFIVAEQQSGPCGWDVMGAQPEPGQLRLWTYQALAHGAEGILYFRFRALPYGMEQYWYGVLDHDGVPRRRYYELQRTGRELEKLTPYIVGKHSRYEALIVRTYDNVWGHEIKSHVKGFDYRSLLYEYYRANARLNIPTAVSVGNYEDYRAVYMPAYNIVHRGELEAVAEYVKEGGTLVVTFRSGGRDPENNLFTDTLPCAFRELAGIEVEEFAPLRKPVGVEGLVQCAARLWCDVIKPVTARVLCTYRDCYFQGKAAVTVNAYGKGKVYYVGCDLEAEALEELVRHISSQAGIAVTEAPRGVEILRREDCTAVLNYNDYEVQTPVAGRNLLTGETFTGKLEGYGAVFIKEGI